MWCVAELDQEYIQKMEDVLATYEKPYNPAQPVVCLDETPVSLHADVRPPIPCRWRRKRGPVWRSRRSQVWGYALACGGRRNGGGATAFLSQAGLSSVLTSGVR